MFNIYIYIYINILVWLYQSYHCVLPAKNLSASHRGGPPRPRPGVRVASPWRSTWWCWVPRASQGNWRVTLGITGRCMGMLGVNWNLEMLWNVARLTGLYWYMFIDVFSMFIGDKLAGLLGRCGDDTTTRQRHGKDRGLYLKVLTSR